MMPFERNASSHIPWALIPSGPLYSKSVKFNSRNLKPKSEFSKPTGSVGTWISYPPGMGFLFEKLEVYQKAVGFGEAAERLCGPISKGNYHLVEQLRRASLSISLNIAEGSGRWHKKDKKQFYLIARGSAYECVPILEILRRKGLIEDMDFENLKTTLDSISKMLTKLIRSTEEPKSDPP